MAKEEVRAPTLPETADPREPKVGESPKPYQSSKGDGGGKRSRGVALLALDGYIDRREMLD